MTDAVFFLMETRATPMHVGGLQLFEPLPEDQDSFATFFSELAQHRDIRQLLCKKLFAPYGLAIGPKWVEDKDFDLEYHVRFSALPQPGRYRELFELTSRLHSIPMDRSRPLWEVHVIDGLQSGELAVYSKLHHSLIDGVAGARLLQSSLSEDPAARDIPPLWSAQHDQRGRSRKSRTGSSESAFDFARRQWQAIPGISESAKEVAQSLLHADQSPLAMPYRAPRCILNQEISGFRRLVSQTWSLQRIRQVGKALGGTLNDVVLAMCAGALRQYLLKIDALPALPLTAIVPVSVRTDDSAEGNAAGTIVVSLATDLESASERFHAIKASSDAAKAALRRMTKEQIIAYSVLVNTPLLLERFLKTSKRLPPIFNLAISNVPGPKQPLYWNGRKLRSSYPFSLLFGGNALNITVLSYADNYEFTVTACRKSLPHIQRIIDDMEDALQELESFAGIR